MTPIASRIGILFALFFGLLAVAGLRAAWLGTVKGDSLQHAAKTQQVADITVPAKRGTIVDRRGIELAVSEPAADISATPYLVKDPVEASRKLAPILDSTEDDLVKKLARKDTGFVYLARKLPADKAQQVAELKLAGIDETQTTLRSYPRDYLAAQLLGNVGTDGKGLSGLEYRFERQLHGADGERRTIKDALGAAIDVQDVKPAQEGARLELSVDSAIQDKAEAVLTKIGETFRPKHATAIVMDPRNGEMLAVANWPRINANDVAHAPAYATQNLATGFTYEPGSTYKAFTVAGALEDGAVRPDTVFGLPAILQVADRQIHDAEARGDISLTTAQILAQSSNVGAVKIGMADGADRFAGWMQKFGFGKPTGSDMAGEEQGLVLPRDKYSGSSMGNLPIGQGTLVTPMQMAAGYAAIANGGRIPVPHVVRKIDGRAPRLAAPRRVISPETAQELRTMLEGVFAPGGTASEVSIPGYKLAGKTGTANKVDPATGEYSSVRYDASFVGFAPALKPKLLAMVVVDEPQGAIYGGEVAAPAFGQIMSFALQYLKIPPG
ncbi:MAG: penicillin-binding protein 2 [Solirubrobacterales bacterium]|nr:penicillin-binding protein 2 [Solirubrobacterales bacterium]